MYSLLGSLSASHYICPIAPAVSCNVAIAEHQQPPDPAAMNNSGRLAIEQASYAQSSTSLQPHLNYQSRLSLFLLPCRAMIGKTWAADCTARIKMPQAGHLAARDDSRRSRLNQRGDTRPWLTKICRTMRVTTGNDIAFPSMLLRVLSSTACSISW